MRWRARNLDDWHTMFCWQPYELEGHWYWLERIERRRNATGYLWEYRPIQRAKMMEPTSAGIVPLHEREGA